MSYIQKISKILPFFLFILISFACQEAQAVKAVIFDCDGVLVDTETLKVDSWTKAFDEIGVEFSRQDCLPYIGHTPKYIADDIKKKKSIEFDTDSFLKRKKEIYEESRKQGVQPISMVVNFLKQLIGMKQNLGIKLGLASSARHEEIRSNLKLLGVYDHFDVIISGLDDLPEGSNKPKPDIYQKCAEDLKIAPADCLVIEDTNADIESAIGAGCIAYAFSNEFATVFPLATKVIVDGSTFERLSSEHFKPLLDLHK